MMLLALLTTCHNDMPAWPPFVVGGFIGFSLCVMIVCAIFYWSTKEPPAAPSFSCDCWEVEWAFECDCPCIPDNCHCGCQTDGYNGKCYQTMVALNNWRD